ncbi:hypothetical protein [uncultured Pontibacter sp.]|uniref:hypothetical protein n=1 Tax=uncultured Pontibacter sp. TaxID=453356 RepID=UPI00260E05C5|nr:hypothetical protein [uncultured Pontibacter sp.]
MKESVLRDYFENRISVESLAGNVKNTQRKATYDTTSVHVEQIKDGSTFQVRKVHLLRLCNEVLNGNLTLEDINSIALALVFSEYFVWDTNTEEGQMIETVIYDWDSPEINFPLTLSNMKFWKQYLETGDYKLGIENK